jgi:hypothetical protein
MVKLYDGFYSAYLLDTTPPKRVPVPLGATGTRLLKQTVCVPFRRNTEIDLLKYC